MNFRQLLSSIALMAVLAVSASSQAHAEPNAKQIASDYLSRGWKAFQTPRQVCDWRKSTLSKNTPQIKIDLAAACKPSCGADQSCINQCADDSLRIFKREFNKKCLYYFPCEGTSIADRLLLFEMLVQSYADVANEWMKPDEENDLSATNGMSALGERIRACGWL